MIRLDYGKGAPPLYRQIYQQLQQQILSGALPVGTRLIASRVQANTLGVSRNTVETAYQQLCAEGYLNSRAGSGYYVQPFPFLPSSDPLPAIETITPSAEK